MDRRSETPYDLVFLPASELPALERIFLRENASILVQCTHWLAYHVGVPRVRELAGAMLLSDHPAPAA